MPCMLKAVRDSNHYRGSTHARIPQYARDNPGIIAKDPQDAAFIALMVLFFALLGTAVVLIAVYCSKRKLDQEFERQGTIQLVSLPGPARADTTASTASTRMSSKRSTIEVKPEPAYPRFHKTMLRQGQTIRVRRNMPDLSFGSGKARLQSGDEGDEPSPMPSLPEPALRSAPRAVFPGTRYGMCQLGNDGRLHRPESIFEYVRP